MEPNQHTNNHIKYLFEHINDAVVVFELVDGEPQILETNNAFRDIFGPKTSWVDKNSLNELIVPIDRLEQAQQFDQRTAMGKPNDAVVKRMTSQGIRTFLYRSISYKNRYGFAIYSDITDKVQQERHLDVIHRVFRHNLRNDLNILMGMASQIANKTDKPDVRKAATKINHTASNLSRLSDEAKTIRQVLDEANHMRPIELQPLSQLAIKDCKRQFETSEITVDIPAGIKVHADEKLRIALQSLLDNAIRHNDNANSQAHLFTTVQNSETIEIAVADNGPGIPDIEQQIITEDARITSLNHGSGLGLWLVKWIVETYNGSIDITTPNGVGSVVHLYLNTADPC